MANLGFVGLGIMGNPIAKRWLDAGHTVTGFNRTRAKCDALIAAGMRWADTPREVAQTADITFSMMADSHALEAIARGPDGVLAGLAPGKIYVDMSTVSPALARDLAREARARGAEMLDAPVSGSIPAINAGTLSFMVGGSKQALDRVEPLFLQIGNKVTYMGESGTAALMKIAINLSLPIQLIAAYEGILLAEKGGIPRERALEAMLNSVVASFALKYRAGFAFNPPSEVWFNVKMMQKDTLVALDQGRALGVPMFTAALSNEMLTAARAQGFTEADPAAIYAVLSRLMDKPAAPSESHAAG